MEEKSLGTIKVTEVVDNADGTCTIRFDVSKEVRKAIVENMGWRRWSNKKFNQFVADSLEYYAKTIEQKQRTTKEEGE
jgi:hypothetical protein